MTPTCFGRQATTLAVHALDECIKHLSLKVKLIEQPTGIFNLLPLSFLSFCFCTVYFGYHSTRVSMLKQADHRALVSVFYSRRWLSMDEDEEKQKEKQQKRSLQQKKKSLLVTFANESLHQLQ